jgi:hypothetical protein
MIVCVCVWSKGYNCSVMQQSDAMSVCLVALVYLSAYHCLSISHNVSDLCFPPQHIFIYRIGLLHATFFHIIIITLTCAPYVLDGSL